MVKINSRARSMVILNSSDLYLNSVIDQLTSAIKKECSISMSKGITFIELMQLSDNHVGEITPLVCQVLCERNVDSGINLRRCDSTLCFLNKLCNNTNEEYLGKDEETHDLSNKTLKISQCKNVIRGRLTNGIAPTHLRTAIYNKGHQQQNNLIYKKTEKINEENKEWKLSQKKKGSQTNNKMCETFHLPNREDRNSDVLSVTFSGGSSLQSDKPSSTIAKEKENLSPSLFKSLLNIPNTLRGNVDCDETVSVNVDVENLVTRDHSAGFKFPTYEKKNDPRCSKGNQISKKDESCTGYIPSSAKFRDLVQSDIAHPNHNSLGVHISNENISDSLSNYGPSHDSTTTNENYYLTPFKDNLICTQKLGGDSTRSDPMSLDIDSGNQNICNKLDNLVQELRKVVVYQYNRGHCYPLNSYFTKRKPQNLAMVRANKNFHIESSTIFVNVPVKDLPTKFRRISSDDKELTCFNLSKCCGTESVQLTKNVNTSLSGFSFQGMQTLPKKPSKIPLKKKSSLYFGKSCFFKHQTACKRKNAASHCSFPCGGTFCCFRHINKPNCNCCNKCVFLKQTCGTTYDANEGCHKGKGKKNEEHYINVNCDNARQVSQTFQMKDENKKFLLFSPNGTPKKTFRQSSANSDDKQTSTRFTHTEMIHTKVSTENNSNLHIASKSSIKPKSLIFRNNEKCNSKNIRKTHRVGVGGCANSDCVIAPICCNDTVSLQTESYIGAKNLLSGGTGDRIKRYSKNNYRMIRNHSRKLNNLESVHILSQFPNKPKSKKYFSKLMNGLIKKENCSDHSIKCKHNCKEKKVVENNVSIRRRKEKIMKDVVGGVELVLDSIKELKKIVYEEGF